jgi:hypothetical protein
MAPDKAGRVLAKAGMILAKAGMVLAKARTGQAPPHGFS